MEQYILSTVRKKNGRWNTRYANFTLLKMGYISTTTLLVVSANAVVSLGVGGNRLEVHTTFSTQ